MNRGPRIPSRHGVYTSLSRAGGLKVGLGASTWVQGCLHDRHGSTLWKLLGRLCPRVAL